MFIALALAAQPTTYISVSSVTGGMLAEMCRVDNGLKMDGCAAYILGAADALQVDGATCRPVSEAATAQTLEIVRRYIRDNPKNWGWSAIALVREPLRTAFPCRRR